MSDNRRELREDGYYHTPLLSIARKNKNTTIINMLEDTTKKSDEEFKKMKANVGEYIGKPVAQVSDGTTHFGKVLSAAPTFFRYEDDDDDHSDGEFGISSCVWHVEFKDGTSVDLDTDKLLLALSEFKRLRPDGSVHDDDADDDAAAGSSRKKARKN